MAVLYIRNSDNTDWLVFYSSGSSMALDDLSDVSSGSDLSAGDILTWGGVEWSSSGNAAMPRIMTMSYSGTLSSGSDDQLNLRFYNISGRTLTITRVFCGVDIAPTDASIIVDIHKDGTTIFTNQAHRPEITSGNYTGNTTSIDVSSFGDSSYLQMIVDQVGSSVSGSDLVVHVVME